MQCTYGISQPLVDPADIAQARDDGLLIEVDGLQYSSEDLYFCRGCGSAHTDRYELDATDLCPTCAGEARMEALAEQEEARAIARRT